MQGSNSGKRFMAFAVVIAACGGVAAWMAQSRYAVIHARPQPMASSEYAPVVLSSSASPPGSPGVVDLPEPKVMDAAAENANAHADEVDAGTKSGCGPLLWMPAEDEKAWERELMEDYPEEYPIYHYVRKAARPFEEAVSALLPNHGERGKCGQGVTLGYDLLGGPARRHCKDNRCYWFVRATIIDDRSYPSDDNVPGAVPWVYWFEVERVGGPIIVDISTSWNESKRFTKMSDAIRFVQELARVDGGSQ